jgi:CRP-like cAMP-binding protein
MTPSHAELLQRMPIFGALGDVVLEFLVDNARVREVARGEFFFREGDVATGMYVLERGRVEVFKTWAGRELIVQRFAAGDCFGEMALLDLAPRSASVRAIEDCGAIEITSADLLRLFERDATSFALIQMNIAREMSRRLRATDERLFRLWVGETNVAPPLPPST